MAYPSRGGPFYFGGSAMALTYVTTKSGKSIPAGLAVAIKGEYYTKEEAKAILPKAPTPANMDDLEKRITALEEVVNKMGKTVS